MRKLIYLIATIFFICIAQLISAQSNYVNHTLKQGESLSALAKQYNTNVGDIMRMNGMHADTKLVFGSVIKIPSSKKEVIIQPIKSATESSDITSNTVTHKIAKGETLYSISKQYNVSLNDLKTWNHLSNNSAKLGSILIVGKDNNSVTANKPVNDTKRQRAETTAPAQTVPEQPQAPQAAVLNNITKDTLTNTVDKDSLSNTPNNVTQNTPENKTDVTNDAIANATPNNNASLAASKNSEGYFADSFKKSRKQQHVSGISKTFKTASGWNDGKYYVLADDINPGTIVKLTADNGSTVYAKVLWNMGNLKENNAINFRISNATAAALNESTDAFNLNIYY